MPFNELASDWQIYLEESAIAAQAQAAHDSKFGPGQFVPTDAQDYLVGWLDHCLLNAGLEQNYKNNSLEDPRTQYAIFLGISTLDHRIESFSYGYSEEMLPPLPLMPPQAGNTNP